MSGLRARVLAGTASVVALIWVLAACSGTNGASTASPAGPVLTSQPVVSAPATTPSGPATPTPTSTRNGHTSGGEPTALSTPGYFVFPVVGTVSYAHTHHDYPATDIIAACGSEVRAATSGIVLEVTRVDRYKASVNAGATRGGLSVSIRGDDGVRYYGSHLEKIDKDIQPGVRVAAGEPLGKVGKTGDASVCHLHFGISPVCQGTGDWWIQRGVVYPWPYLDSWRTGGDKSPVAAINAWHKKYGCPTKPLVDP